MSRSGDVIAIDAKTGATEIIDGISGASAKIDAVSGATRPEFTTWEFVEGDRVRMLIGKHDTACILSTTNPDGTPHVSAIHPEYVKDGTIKYALAYTQTRKNIDRNGSAILTIYSVSCENGTHAGAQIMLKRQGVVTESMETTKALRVVYMLIEDILPLVD